MYVQVRIVCGVQVVRVTILFADSVAVPRRVEVQVDVACRCRASGGDGQIALLRQVLSNLGRRAGEVASR